MLCANRIGRRSGIWHDHPPPKSFLRTFFEIASILGVELDLGEARLGPIPLLYLLAAGRQQGSAHECQ